VKGFHALLAALAIATGAFALAFTWQPGLASMYDDSVSYLIQAQALWSDPDRIEGPGRSTDEPRFQIVGQIAETTWTATVTYRHEETIRLISVRRTRDSEKAQYLDAQPQRH